MMDERPPAFPDPIAWALYCLVELDQHGCKPATAKRLELEEALLGGGPGVWQAAIAQARAALGDDVPPACPTPPTCET